MRAGTTPQNIFAPAYLAGLGPEDVPAGYRLRRRNFIVPWSFDDTTPLTLLDLDNPLQLDGDWPWYWHGLDFGLAFGNSFTCTPRVRFTLPTGEFFNDDFVAVSMLQGYWFPAQPFRQGEILVVDFQAVDVVAGAGHVHRGRVRLLGYKLERA